MQKIIKILEKEIDSLRKCSDPEPENDFQSGARYAERRQIRFLEITIAVLRKESADRRVLLGEIETLVKSLL